MISILKIIFKSKSENLVFITCSNYLFTLKTKKHNKKRQKWNES